MENMLWIGEGLISKNRIKTLQSVIKEFEMIKPNDIQRVAKEIFNPKRFNLALVGPVADEQEKQLSQLMGV